MKTSASRYTCILLNSILAKKVLAVTALLLTSQVVLAGGSHPHQWLIDTTVILENSTTVTDPQGNVVITDCFAEGELRLRSRWTSRCPPYRPSVGRWSDCPPPPGAPGGIWMIRARYASQTPCPTRHQAIGTTAATTSSTVLCRGKTKKETVI